MSTSGEQKYRQIASDLRTAIHGGEYGPGSRLPGENDIMRDYQVARMTARQALALLINEGLATPRRGAGVYVREFRPVIRDSIARLSSETWGAGRSVWAADVGDRDLNVEVLEVRQGDPPEYVGLLLDLADDPDAQVVVRNRRYILDGKPVLLAVSYLPAKIAAGTPIEQPDPGPGGTYARLADLGYAPVRFREDLRSRMPEPEEAEQLSLPPGTPVVEIIRTAYTAADQVVEVNMMTADASAYIFRYGFATSSS